MSIFCTFFVIWAWTGSQKSLLHQFQMKTQAKIQQFLFENEQNGENSLENFWHKLFWRIKHFFNKCHFTDADLFQRNSIFFFELFVFLNGSNHQQLSRSQKFRKQKSAQNVKNSKMDNFEGTFFTKIQILASQFWSKF